MAADSDSNDQSAIEDEMKWIKKFGITQLGQLNEMERHQDWITWTTNAVYTTMTAALIAGAIVLLVQEFVSTSVSWVGLIFLIFGSAGALVSTGWFGILIRAHTYEIIWLLRAKALQIKVGVPEVYRIWQENPPRGKPSWLTVSRLVEFFFLGWIVVVTLGASMLVYGLLRSGFSASEWISTFFGVVAALAVLGVGRRAYSVIFLEAKEIFDSNKAKTDEELCSVISKIDTLDKARSAESSGEEHQNPSHRDIVVKLDRLEDSSTLNLVVALFAISFSILALGGAVQLKSGVVGAVAGVAYLLAALFVALFARHIWRKHKETKGV